MGKTLFIAEKPKVAVELLKSPRFRNSQRYPGASHIMATMKMKITLLVGAVGTY